MATYSGILVWIIPWTKESELDLNHRFVVILISSTILSDDSRAGSRAEEGKNSLHKMIDRGLKKRKHAFLTHGDSQKCL